MSARGHNDGQPIDRPKVADVYEEIRELRRDMNERFATKNELRLSVVVAVVCGGTVSALVTGKSSPAAQAAFYYGRVKGWV